MAEFLFLRGVEVSL